MKLMKKINPKNPSKFKKTLIRAKKIKKIKR